ncbi:hypothetical protein [Thiorhodospira sibirica]|uniref:hypothetical protein n=1 Tax=Thiorhodospira sibirica TaxID=154347 RepID=UPI00022C2E10|nr:hypothetical protein [Thiorhodospira sibirica]
MSLVLEGRLPADISEREACHALDLCRNSLRAARDRYHFCGPVSPHRRKRKDIQQPRALSADADQAIIEKGVNFPTLQRVIEKAI